MTPLKNSFQENFDNKKIDHLVETIFEFLQQDKEMIRERVEKEIDNTGINVAEAWNSKQPKNKDEILKFYRETDSYIFDLLIEHNRPIREQLRKLILSKLKNYSRINSILDYGSGLGIDAKYFDRNNYNVTAYELESKTANFSKFLIQNEKSNVKLVTSQDNLSKYDAVICLEVLEHVTNPTETLSKIYSHLNQNGILILTESFEMVGLNYPSHLLENQKYGNSWKNEAEKIGFTIVDQFNLVEGKKVFLLAKYQPVDIILCVHNASKEFSACVNSLLIHWNQGPHKLVVIDDGSTESEVNEIIETIQEKKFVTIKRHQKAAGLVRSENEGIEASNNHIILLNSDTIVTKNWVPNLIEVALSDEKIGTVTPLSNNASIYSWLASMPSGEYSDANKITEFLSRHSKKLFPRIPVGVGFCIFIKREVFDKIGLLDHETFGLGYGEETDLCLRANNSGFYNVLADNIFIFHKGGSSFKPIGHIKEDQITTPENEAKLLKKYPHYPELLKEFRESRTMDDIRMHLDFWLSREILSKRKKLMYFLHHPVKQEIIGGTEKHVEHLVDNFKQQFGVYVISGDDSNFVYVQEFVDNFEFTYIFPQKHVSRKVSTSDWKKMNLLLNELFTPNLIHIHHTINSSFDIFEVANNVKVPTVYTVHDYYAVCPNYNLINSETNEFCDIPTDHSICESCLTKKFGSDNFSLKKWRNDISRLIQKCDIVVYPSESAKSIFRRVYAPKKEVVIPHGTMELSNNYSTKGLSKSTDQYFSVGFIGYLSVQKGLELIKKTIPLLLKNKINVHFFGPIDKTLAKKSKIGKARVFYHGKFDSPEELHNKLQSSGVKLIGILAPWPETFSYVLSESWDAGIPVVVSPFGALKERVEKNQGGIVLSQATVDKFVETIISLSKSPEKYQTLVNNVSKIEKKTINKMCNQYLELYKSLINTHKETKTTDVVNHILENILKSSILMQTIVSTTFSFGEYNKIYDSPQKTKEGYSMLTKNEWKSINALFPYTNRKSKMMKRYIALSLYLWKYGLRKTTKRIFSLLRL